MSIIKINKTLIEICDGCGETLHQPCGSLGWDRNGFNQPIDFDLCGMCIQKYYEELYGKSTNR